MRRSRICNRYVGTNADVDPAHYYSPFYWNYLLPQGMLVPKRINRMASPAPKRGMKRAFQGVWIETDMHPVFRVALDPYLRKLALTRAVPATRPSEAVEDYRAHAKLVGDVRSRHGWLAKVAQLCAMHKSSADVLPLWAEECHAMYVTGSQVPAVPLAMAMCYCTATARDKDWRAFFTCCLKARWNVTPHFTNVLWSRLLECAGGLDDEEGVLALIDEMVDLQVNFTTLGTHGFIWALNAVRSPTGYERIKKLLFTIEVEKINAIQANYVILKSKAELDEEFGATFKSNDNMFYHVHWHRTIRNPMAFVPRRLFFDYKPVVAADDNINMAKKTAEKLLEERLATWKAQGLVPENYVDETKVQDKSETFAFWQRQETWKKKPTWITKHKGYTPYEATQ